MANKIYDEQSIQNIANAIRSKNGETGKYKVSEMAQKILNIPTGSEPTYETPSITVSDGGLISASANGKTGTKQLTTKSAQTIDPTESVQTAVPVGTFVIGEIKINAIPSSYIGSAIARRSGTDLTVNGATVTVPSGYYSAQATKSVASGSAGTPSASKGTVSNHQISITPTVTNTTGYITGGTKTGTAVTVKASDLVSGSETKTANGTYDVTNLEQLVVNVSGGGGLPSGISAFDFGTITVSSAFTTTRQTFNHNLGVVPDLMIVWHKGNVATTYSMLAAIRGADFGWRSSAYNSHYAYHGNSTTTVTWANSNSTAYGISNMTASTFQLSSHSTSYYWRAGTYNYIAIKFS